MTQNKAVKHQKSYIAAKHSARCSHNKRISYQNIPDEAESDLIGF